MWDESYFFYEKNIFLPVVRQKFTANVVVGLFGNESPDSNRFTIVTPKPENGVRLQATLQSEPHGLARGSSQFSRFYTKKLFFW